MKCRLCNKTALKLYYKQGFQNQYLFYKCKTCGLVNLDLEKVNLEGNQTKYAENYKDPHSNKKNKGSYKTYLFIKKNIETKGSYLDIGCGNGSLLNFAKQDGWAVKGLELSGFLAKSIKETLDIDVEVRNFLDYKDSNVQYDLVSLRHVLEHLPDSISAMTQINQLLKHGGMAVFEFPNIEGISLKTKRFFSKIGVYKKKYPVNYVPGHCNEFSKKSFNYLLNQTGFELIKWETYSGKKFANLFYKITNSSTKARALVRKINLA